VEGDDNFLVVADVVLGKGAPLTVLEPLVTDLIAADVEVPDLLRDAAETEGAGLAGAVVFAPVGSAGI